MTTHDMLDDDLRDEAAAFVLGSLSEEESRRYRLHVAACATCRREVEEVRAVTDRLGALVPEVEPPPALWGRVLERIRATPRPPPDAPGRAPRAEADDEMQSQVWKRWADDGASGRAFAYALRTEGEFEPTSQPGVRARRLFVDAQAGRVSMLVRMDPGSSYPAHRHAGAEDCYVLAGDLHAGERRLHAGDYIRSAPGSVHAVQSTEGGCELFIVSSLHDELLV